MKRLAMLTLWLAFAVMIGATSRATGGGIYHIRNTTIFSNKDIAVSSDTTFNVPVTMTEDGTVVSPTKYSERPYWILWEVYGKHLSRSADSTYRVDVRSLINGVAYNITSPGSSIDSLKVIAPWSAGETLGRGFVILSPAISDTFSIRITNPHPVLTVDSLTVGWRWIRVY